MHQTLWVWANFKTLISIWDEKIMKNNELTTQLQLDNRVHHWPHKIPQHSPSPGPHHRETPPAKSTKILPTTTSENHSRFRSLSLAPPLLGIWGIAEKELHMRKSTFEAAVIRESSWKCYAVSALRHSVPLSSGGKHGRVQVALLGGVHHVGGVSVPYWG